MFNTKFLKTIFAFALICILISACDMSEKGPDVSNIETDFKFLNFEEDFSKLDTVNIDASLTELSFKYPQLFPIYFNEIVPIYAEDQQTFKTSLKKMLGNPGYKKLRDTVKIEFSSTELLEKDLKKACQYLKHYFPKKLTPHFYSVISEFGFQNFIFNDKDRDGIGIGLDMFLGASFPYKSLDPSNPSFSQYLTRTYNKEHLVKKSIEPVVLDIIGEPNGKRLIDHMIHQGKKLYILERLLPFVNDTIINEYTPSQLDWCNNNEQEIWSFFLEKNLLYETSMLKINRYLKPAPSSTGMPKESPGRTAAFIGKQIVNKYMERNPDMTLSKLVKSVDSQKILTASKYKPKRK